ncbi:MAG: hypothetical protein AAGA53_13745 [Pseudomonadota bacterium]
MRNIQKKQFSQGANFWKEKFQDQSANEREFSERIEARQALRLEREDARQEWQEKRDANRLEREEAREQRIADRQERMEERRAEREEAREQRRAEREEARRERDNDRESSDETIENWSNGTNHTTQAASQQQNWVQFDEDTGTYLVGVGVTAAELNALIATVEAGATILLEDGVHEFNETIVIERGDINVVGESENGTTLNFTFPSGTGGNAIEIKSGQKSVETELQTTAIAGSSVITVADASNLQPGDVLYISQPNTLEYLLQNDWDNVSFEDADARPFREFIVRVEAVSGNAVSLASPLPYEFEALETDISHINLLENVALSNFTVTSGLITEPNYYDFVNTFPEFQNTAVVYVRGADGINLSMISVLDAPSSAFDFRSTLDLVANDLYVNGAHNLGGGGNGYGINLYETFDATITDAEIYNVRHAVLFSSWNAETGNYVEVTSTNRDINFHGSPDVGNEVVVLQAVLDYDPSQNTGSTNGFWDIVSGGGSRHANTDFFENNSVVFSYAEGSQGSETIYAADGGAYIDAKGSQDVVIGGSGNDILIGGKSRDLLTGGEGADIFGFTLGDSYDVITDFSGAEEGDQIYLTGNPNLLSFDDLRIWQSELDTYVRYGASSTIILSDYDATDLIDDYFIIDPFGDSGVLV